VGGSVRHYIEKGRAWVKFTAMKVPRQCPLVLLVKVVWRGGKTFGREECIDERWSRGRSWAGFHCTQLEPCNHILNLGRAAYGEILIFIWGRLVRAKFLCEYWEGCMRGMQCHVEFGVNSACALRTEENHGKPWSGWPIKVFLGPQSKCWVLRIQSVPQREHHTSPLQRSTD
jgi:hypothetical protein